MKSNEDQAIHSRSKPRVLVVGTGAIGGFYGGKLAQAGARVGTLCRSYYDIVKTKGISVTSVTGNFLFTPETVVREIKEYAPPPDFILVGLKVLPQIDPAQIIAGGVGPGTAILLLQNGVEIEDSLAQAFPDNEILSGLAFICVTRTIPGHIDHSDYGRLVLGRFPRGPSTRAEHLAKLFNEAGVPCEITEDVVTARWGKLIWNASFNPISVLGGGADTKTMMESPESVSLAQRVMEEVRMIAEAAGHPLPTDVVQKNLDGTWRMKPYKTSMLVDFEAGRPMEVEAILGNALRVAERHSVATPHLESLYNLLKMIDRKSK